MQQHRRVVTDSRHLLQLLHRRVQHLGKAAEPVQKGMGNGIGVLHGDGVEQQQLQGLHVRKAVQACTEKPIFQSFPVTLMG